MKSIQKYTTAVLLVLLVTLTACEDVIDVDVPETAPRLVIEASINWEKGTLGSNQTVTLSTSTPYFNTNQTNVVIGASVKITNTDTNAEFLFIDQNNGEYNSTNFVPLINSNYDLEVLYNGDVYVASETFKSVSEINTVTQSLEGGFDDEVLEVTIFFDDPIDEQNYYLASVFEAGDLFAEVETFSDEFINGNEVSEFFEKESDDEDDQQEYNPGDQVTITLIGISERYYNYMDLLIEQYYSGGNPFASTPAEIKGNCINETNPSNYAFGFFRLSEKVTINYTFE